MKLKPRLPLPASIFDETTRTFSLLSLLMVKILCPDPDSVDDAACRAAESDARALENIACLSPEIARCVGNNVYAQQKQRNEKQFKEQLCGNSASDPATENHAQERW